MHLILTFQTVSALSILSNLSTSTIPSIDSSFSPSRYSTPKPRPQIPSTDSEQSSNATLQQQQRKPSNLRVLVVNCQCIRNKRTSLAESVDYLKPDVIIGNESWLADEHKTSNFFPKGFQSNVIRNNRDKHGGGVFIAIHDSIQGNEVKTDPKCELAWAEIRTKRKSVLVGSYYRPPNSDIGNLEDLSSQIRQLTEKRDREIILGGDFNLPHIDWSNFTVNKGANDAAHHKELLDMITEHGLEQLQRKPSRKFNILDLYLTNNPSLVKSCDTVPGIGDHHMVVVDSDIMPSHVKKRSRTIYMFKRADIDKIKQKLTALSDTVLSMDGCSVEERWCELRDGINKIIKADVPSKKTSNKNKLPWLTGKIRKLIKQKHRAFKKAKSANIDTAWEKYRQLKGTVQRECRRAYWSYIDDVLKPSMEDGNNKPFWRFVKSRRQDNIGVSDLRVGSTLHNDNQEKAEILNDQFTSVFSKEDNSPLPPIPDRGIPDISNIKITAEGVTKLLKNIKVDKASGPDLIPNYILKNCSSELSPALTSIFQQSLDTGDVPSDWRNASIAPVFKKGDRHTAANYRPVSLTSVCCKLLEHIICRHMMNHLEDNHILTSLQHGFRSGHSCETQLLVTMDDLLKNIDKQGQTDMTILDFSKAFDVVPHKRLLHKLEKYGITGKTHGWIRSFLSDRLQKVVVNGESSKRSPVMSGVPQGTVLGPILFLLYINDLPECVRSQVRLFADDCLLYRKIKSFQDQVDLQRDLTALQDWAQTWGMKFNAKKCYVMSVTTSTKPLRYRYNLDGHVLKQVTDNPYLGVLISENGKWNNHIDKTTKRASCTLGFLRRNLRKCNKQFKETAYKSLVRSTLEYAAVVWDPQRKEICKSVEAVQRKAARFVCNDWGQTSSVDAMINELRWEPLADRRRNLRLSMLFKILNGKVCIPATEYTSFTKRKTRSNFYNANSKTLISYSCRIDIYKDSFFPQTIEDWNELPDQSVTSNTIEQFKASLLRRQ